MGGTRLFEEVEITGQLVLPMEDAAADSITAGVPDGAVRLYNDGTNVFLQFFSLATGAWATFKPAGAISHDTDLTGVSADDHHNESHTAASHSDQGATGAELETLTDGSNADSLHAHAGVTVVRKTADETVNASATYQDDDHLSFAVGANESWAIEIHGRCTVLAASDIKFRFTVPSGASMPMGVVWMGNSTSEFVSSDMTGGITAADATIRGSFHLYAIYIGGSNAGTVQLQWAQDTAVAENTILNSGAWLKAAQI